MALVSFVQARLEVLVVNVATGVGKDSEVFTTTQASTVEAIEKTCSEVVGGIPESQVSQLLHAIAEAPITEDQRARLRITFNNLLSEAGPLKRLQTVHAPEEFLPKELWDTLRCPTECAEQAGVLGWLLAQARPAEPQRAYSKRHRCHSADE